jgi:hypothetical protein
MPPTRIGLERAVGDTQFRRDNHYLSQGYLKPWGGTDGRVWTYSLLVQHPNVSQWKQRSTRGLAHHAHLYTRMVAGSESDRIERWLAEEFENPAAEAVLKATTDRQLSQEDRKLLIRFLAAHDVRTPAWFLASKERWSKTLPELMEDVTRRALSEHEAGLRTGRPRTSAIAPSDARPPLRVRIHQEERMIETAALVGREMWLWAMERSLSSTIRALYQHRWTILAPPEGMTWPTSDSPVVKLNFMSFDNYTFGGGWGSQGTEIFFPLGPLHLMYTQIGDRPPRRGERVPVEQAHWIRRFIVEHASRLILAREEDHDVPNLRRRREDAELYERERLMWERWHTDQVEAERDFGK